MGEQRDRRQGAEAADQPDREVHREVRQRSEVQERPSILRDLLQVHADHLGSGRRLRLDLLALVVRQVSEVLHQLVLGACEPVP